MLLRYLNQLLKSPAGKYSRKSFITIVSFIVTMNMGVMLVVTDCFLKYEPSDLSKSIFDSMLLFVIGMTTSTVVDKKLTTKNGEKPKNEEEE